MEITANSDLLQTMQKIASLGRFDPCEDVGIDGRVLDWQEHCMLDRYIKNSEGYHLTNFVNLMRFLDSRETSFIRMDHIRITLPSEQYLHAMFTTCEKLISSEELLYGKDCFDMKWYYNDISIIHRHGGKQEDPLYTHKFKMCINNDIGKYVALTFSGFKKIRERVLAECAKKQCLNNHKQMKSYCLHQFPPIEDIYDTSKATYLKDREEYMSKFSISKTLSQSGNSKDIPVAVPIVQETKKQSSAKSMIVVRTEDRAKFIVSADIQSKLEDLIDSLDEFTISYYDNEVVDDDASVIVIENISKENILVAMRMYK